MADRIGIKATGFDEAVKMLKKTAPDEAKKQVRASMRFATNRVKAKLKAVAPRGERGVHRGGRFYAPGFLARKGIVSRSSTSSKKGSFTAKIQLTKDAWYGWVVNVGRYITGGTYKRGKYVTPLKGSYWIDKAINTRKVANDAVSEFSRRFGR